MPSIPRHVLRATTCMILGQPALSGNFLPDRLICGVMVWGKLQPCGLIVMVGCEVPRCRVSGCGGPSFLEQCFTHFTAPWDDEKLQIVCLGDVLQIIIYCGLDIKPDRQGSSETHD